MATLHVGDYESRPEFIKIKAAFKAAELYTGIDFRYGSWYYGMEDDIAALNEVGRRHGIKDVVAANQWLSYCTVPGSGGAASAWKEAMFAAGWGEEQLQSKNWAL